MSSPRRSCCCWLTFSKSPRRVNRLERYYETTWLFVEFRAKFTCPTSEVARFTRLPRLAISITLLGHGFTCLTRCLGMESWRMRRYRSTRSGFTLDGPLCSTPGRCCRKPRRHTPVYNSHTPFQPYMSYTMYEVTWTSNSPTHYRSTRFYSPVHYTLTS